jgi:hypothetical protein
VDSPINSPLADNEQGISHNPGVLEWYAGTADVKMGKENKVASR